MNQAQVNSLINQLQGNHLPSPVPVPGLRSSRSSGHGHNLNRNPYSPHYDDHHNRHNHHLDPLGRLIRTVSIRRGLIPLGCQHHTFVGSSPILVANVSQYNEPLYKYPDPIYQNAPRFGAGSSYPSQVSYQVDPTSQVSTRAINFRKNSVEMADMESVQFLSSLGAALNSPTLLPHSFVIEGHASAEGSAVYNHELSQLRANAVHQFLVDQGVDPARLLAVGHGESQAVYSSSDPEYLRAQDRRVMIFKLAY